MKTATISPRVASIPVLERGLELPDLLERVRGRGDERGHGRAHLGQLRDRPAGCAARDGVVHLQFFLTPPSDNNKKQYHPYVRTGFAFLLLWWRTYLGKGADVYCTGT